MYIERVPNRNSPPAVLLRESYRDHGRVCKRTLANLSKWPDHLVEGLRTLLKGGVALPSLDSAFEILRSRPHGHVAATLGAARRRGLETLLDRRPSRERALALAMIIARILEPRSKLATARGLSSETTTHTLGEELGVEEAGADELYSAMDWLLKRQQRIERRLAEQHLKDGCLVLCDVTSVYFEGAKCALARRGYSKDGKHFDTEIDEDGFRYCRNQTRIAEEAALDGFYVIRTNVAEADLPAPEAVRAYKSLSRVERQAHTARTTRPQLPDPARRPGHPDPKSRPNAGPRERHRGCPGQTDTPPGRGIQPPQPPTMTNSTQ